MHIKLLPSHITSCSTFFLYHILTSVDFSTFLWTNLCSIRVYWELLTTVYQDEHTSFLETEAYMAIYNLILPVCINKTVEKDEFEEHQLCCNHILSCLSDIRILDWRDENWNEKWDENEKIAIWESFYIISIMQTWGLEAIEMRNITLQICAW